MVRSRRKGKDGEREWARWLRERGVEARRGQQYRGDADAPDVVSSLPVRWEVKRTEALRLWDAVDQVVAEAAPDEVPVVVHRRSRRPWVCIVPAEHMLRALRALYKLAAAEARLGRYKKAVDGLFKLTDWPEGGDLDGCQFQEWAIRHGLLVGVEVSEPCGDEWSDPPVRCFCSEYHGRGDFPVTCYRRAEEVEDE